MKNHNIDKGSLSYDMVIVPPEGGTIMINSNAYDYINVLDKAADAAWIRNDAIANNIANVDTPGYKRQDVDFEGELQRALGNSKYTSMDEKVSALKTRDLTPRTYTDSANFSYRLDGNNVDIEKEQLEMWDTYAQYTYLSQNISKKLQNMSYVINNTGK